MIIYEEYIPGIRIRCIMLIIALLTVILSLPAKVWPKVLLQQDLWMGLIAEDTSGDYQVYLSIASVVKTRLGKGMDNGLVALRRRDLIDFVAREYSFALRTKNIDLEDLTKRAIKETFEHGRNYANGADHYEHTGVYPVPWYAKNMRIVKVMYPRTKKEITFYKGEYRGN